MKDSQLIGKALKVVAMQRNVPIATLVGQPSDRNTKTSKIHEWVAGRTRMLFSDANHKLVTENLPFLKDHITTEERRQGKPYLILKPEGLTAVRDFLAKSPKRLPHQMPKRVPKPLEKMQVVTTSLTSSEGNKTIESGQTLTTLSGKKVQMVKELPTIRQPRQTRSNNIPLNVVGDILSLARDKKLVERIIRVCDHLKPMDMCLADLLRAIPE